MCDNSFENYLRSPFHKYSKMLIHFFIIGESISTDSIRNCMKMLEKLEILEILSSTGVRQVSLTDRHDNRNSVKEIIGRLQKTVPIIS